MFLKYFRKRKQDPSPENSCSLYITMGDERKQDPTTVSVVSKRVKCYNTWGWVTKARTPPPPPSDSLKLTLIKELNVLYIVINP